MRKDRTFLGNPAPKFTFGFNNYLSYKGFDLNIFRNGSVGNKAINLIRRTFTDPMRNSNLLKEATGIAQSPCTTPKWATRYFPMFNAANADATKYNASLPVAPTTTTVSPTALLKTF